MSTDPKTLAVYQDRAEDYARMFANAKPSSILNRFIETVPKGARVLDLGCGPGDSGSLMLQAGLDVDLVDASPAMISIARDRHGLPARLATFDDLDAVAAYGAVWANFSLLHAPRADLPRYLSAIHRALVPGGYFHIGMKVGDGEHRDALGRFYTYVSRDELVALLADAGFGVIFEDHFVETGLAGSADPGLTLLARTAMND